MCLSRTEDTCGHGTRAVGFHTHTRVSRRGKQGRKQGGGGQRRRATWSQAHRAGPLLPLGVMALVGTALTPNTSHNHRGGHYTQPDVRRTLRHGEDRLTPGTEVRVLTRVASPSLSPSGCAVPGDQLLDGAAQAAVTVPAGACWPGRPRGRAPAPESWPGSGLGLEAAPGCLWVLAPRHCLQGGDRC